MRPYLMMSKANAPRIVVIDDDDYVSDPIRMLAELQGWAATSYKSCETFLADFDVSDPPACIVLDLHFPKMSGVELLQQLRDLDQRIPVIVLTAHPDGPLIGPAQKAGATEILTKPVDGDELVARICAALAGDDSRASSSA